MALRRRAQLLTLAFAALALAIASCSPVTSTVIDGYAVGSPRCVTTPQDDWEAAQCNRFTTFARAMFDKAQLPHSPIVLTEIYREPEEPGILRTYSGFADFAYVVFRMADGSAAAQHVRAGAGANADICFLLPRDPSGNGIDGDCPADIQPDRADRG